MKKKNFSLMAVVMFMVSTITVNANTQKDVIDNTDCWALADATQADYERRMGNAHQVSTHFESFKVWEAAYLGCI